MRALFAALALLLAGCAARDPYHELVTLDPVKDESEVLVACPDDGVHAIVGGRCVEPCDLPSFRVNGVCVDPEGK